MAIVTGSTSVRLAKKIETEFGALTGHKCEVDFFSIAEGFWRTSHYSQCYRWEAFVWEIFPEGHRCLRVIGSYSTMTDYLKKNRKIVFTPDTHPGHYEAEAILKEPEPCKEN